MKFSTYLTLAIGMLFLLQASSISPGQAAPQKAKGSSASAWPLWYRYDQHGLKLWNTGKKDEAVIYFKKALDIGDATLGGRKNLDPITEKRFRGVLDHQLFANSIIKKPHPGSLVGASGPEQKALALDAKISQTADKIRLVEKVKRIYIKYFGKDGKKSFVFDRTIARLRIMDINDKASVEQARGWPPRSYDNGGKFSKDKYFHINKDGTTTSMDKPSEAALNRTNPNYDENEWVKKNNPTEKKSGSHYRGTSATQGHHAPEWYRSNKHSSRHVDRSEKNRFKGTTWRQTTKGGQGYVDRPDNIKKAWGDTSRQTKKKINPRIWGSARQLPKEIKRNQVKQARPWGSGPVYKKTTKPTNGTTWGRNKGKYQVPTQEIPKEYLKKPQNN